MKTRRTFIKAGFLAGLSINLPWKAIATSAIPLTDKNNKEWKHWVWTHPNDKDTVEALQKRYERYYQAGIRGIFFEADSEKHFRQAKAARLEAHRWMWTLNQGDKSLLESHPEWYAKNRKGESCADQPPYVDYYRWLCPSRPEVINYLEQAVTDILAKDYVDGIHLDYIRFSDVILPVNLWDKYSIEQTSELPEYDYCYCEVCQAGYKAWRDTDILSIPYPQESLSWRLYRYRAINHVVNSLAKVAKSKHKPITAAVFPTPEVAKRIVRQDWKNWDLNGVAPMIYHGFYKEEVSWIGDAVAEGVQGLNGRFPLYAGLYLPDFKHSKELHLGITYALQNGAAGVSLFGDINEEVLQILENAATH
ncbi:family 10 glycosylhydrolase [Anditalea andensis]|uniref:family 10 glycosylhydrolase n=1 Tax=Anditalea andensis TaxID=1048983 RepID=UPI00054FC3B7|nr:family 10 glycosylhydrolase [Anditalea andensis]